MKNVLVHSTKYDGSLHYRYVTTMVRAEDGLLMLYSPPGTPLESYRGSRVTEFHTLGLFWIDRGYNLDVVWHEDWRPYEHYVNIATPATWHDGTLRFVDLDLDVIWNADTGEVVLDDEDEFELHQVRYSYPSDLIERSLRASAEVRELIAQRSYPFDGSLHAWRPHAAP